MSAPSSSCSPSLTKPRESPPAFLDATIIDLPWAPQSFVLTIDNVFSPEECDALIKETERRGYEAALLNIGGGRQVLDTEYRNNDRCIVDSVADAEGVIRSFLP